MGIQDNPNMLISVVNSRGRVMYVKTWELENIRRQGGRVISNPKEDYYREMDQELNRGILKNDIVINDNPDVLETEEI